MAHHRDEFVFDAYRFFTLLDFLKRLITHHAVFLHAPGRIGDILHRKQRMKAAALGRRQARHGGVLNTGRAIPQRGGDDVPMQQRRKNGGGASLENMLKPKLEFVFLQLRVALPNVGPDDLIAGDLRPQLQGSVPEKHDVILP